jgi:hypothetical protein
MQRLRGTPSLLTWKEPSVPREMSGRQPMEFGEDRDWLRRRAGASRPAGAWRLVPGDCHLLDLGPDIGLWLKALSAPVLRASPPQLPRTPTP